MTSRESKSDMVLENESSRLEGTYDATGEEQWHPLTRTMQNYVMGSKPKGSPMTDNDGHEERRLRFASSTLSIGTWNMRSMSLGKIEIVKEEMIRTKTGVLGVAELRWRGSGHFTSDKHKVFYSGNENSSKNGVAFIVTKSIIDAVLGYKTVSDRIITLRLHAQPMNITLIQVYAPTSAASDEAKDDFYQELQHTLDQVTKKDVVYAIGDWNAKVGRTAAGSAVGKFGLGERKDEGERMVEFCEQNNLFVC